jgi:predicted Zn-dependent protease
LSPRPFIALLAAAFFSQGILAQGLPDLGDISSASLSDAQEKTIGNRIMREIYADPDYVDDPELTDYVTSVGQRLLSVADNPPKDMTYFVVRDDSVNAFALVGGHIGIHTGLITLTQNESELAGVMAHETGHILQKHQARFIHNASHAQWTSLAALALAVLASRAGGSGQGAEAAMVGAQALQIQNQIDFTRENEREADRVGFQLLQRAGYDPRAMQTFFERMLRANRLNEYKGMPSYFRTHPLTTERIAEMADRAERLPGIMYGENSLNSMEYRLMRAKVLAETGSPKEAVKVFRTMLEDETVVRPRENVYGLAYALRRAHDFDGAWKTLQPIRSGASHPAIELLAGQILVDLHRSDEALAVYRKALKDNPDYRAIVYAYLDQMLQTGKAKEVLADLEDRLRARRDDWRLYELQARAFAATGRPISQHRAQAEAYARHNNLPAAVDQLEIAVRQTKGSDFYEMSIAESRLRELRVQLENEKAAEKALKIS